MFKITCEFSGGPHDGRVVTGALGDGSDAERFFLFSHHGDVGRRLKIASPYAVEMLASECFKTATPNHFQQHHYVITDRVEDDQEVRIRAEYTFETVRDDIVS